MSPPFKTHSVRVSRGNTQTDALLDRAVIAPLSKIGASYFLIERRAAISSIPLMKFEGVGHCPTRHGDVVFQVISSFVAHSVDLSVWQDVQGFGILYLSVIAGDMNLKVCELTNEPGTP